MPKLEKHSAAARERMAHLRSLRKKNGGSVAVPDISPPSPSPSPSFPPEKPEEVGKVVKGKSKNPRIKFVADYAHKNNMNYFEALKDPNVKKGYNSQSIK